MTSPPTEIPVRNAVGIATLDALDNSPLLQTDDQAIITAVLDVTVWPLVEEYDVGDQVEES